LHSFSSLLDGRVRRRDLELVTRYLRPGWSEETTGSLKFLGNPNCPFAHVPNRRRQDCLHQTNTVQQRGPWSSKGKGSHDWVFRRSIAWLPDSLSTLRRVRYLTTTQDSLPVAGQALLNGLFTRKVPMKGFKVASLHSYPPFPSFLDANRVALGGCPPRAPADPDVLALEHPVPLVATSLRDTGADVQPIGWWRVTRPHGSVVLTVFRSTGTTRHHAPSAGPNGANTAIRRRCVDMGSKLKVFTMFPPDGLTTRHPLLVFPSLHRVATGMTSPGSTVL
jgi:hypothetical protein